MSGGGIEGTGKRSRATAAFSHCPDPRLAMPRAAAGREKGGNVTAAPGTELKKCQNVIQPLALKSFIKRLIALRAKLEAD